MKTNTKVVLSAVLVLAVLFGALAIVLPTGAASPGAASAGNAAPGADVLRAGSLAANLLTPGALTSTGALPPDFSGNVGPRVNTADDPPGAIYVSPGGDDRNATGSVDAPFRSINTALAAASPGDTIILRGGTYREGRDVRVRKSNVTIRSAKGEWAVIDLTDYNPGNEEHSAVEFYAEDETTGGIVTGCKLQSVEVIGGFYAVSFDTKWDWGQADRSGASNIIVEDCVLHDSRNDLVKVKPGCDDITIRYNEIYNSGRAYSGRSDFDTGEYNSEGIDNVNGDRMHVHNNYIHDICSTGIYAKGGAIDALIENNILERTYAAGIMVGFDTSPEFFDLAVNPKYYENISGVVRNNLIIDAGWEGIGLYASMDAQVYNNTITNAVCGPLQYHSPIYFGVATQDWGNSAGCPPNVNPCIHHNIVSQPSSYSNRMIDIRYATGVYSFGLSGLEGAPSMSDNCYYVADGSARFTDNRPGSALTNAGLAAWQAHIGGDAGSIEAYPSLDAEYMPANPYCFGMGITSFLAQSDPPLATGCPPFDSMSMANFSRDGTYTPGLFGDVDEYEWYGYYEEQFIAAAFEAGLITGYEDGTFRPAEEVTLADLITLAARVARIYRVNDDDLVMGEPWYRVYADYAISVGIIDAPDFPDFDRPATRAEMAYIFAHCLPDYEFALLTSVNSLPDVDEKTPYSSEIFMLYEAGVFSGNDTAGTFNPYGVPTRAEAAGIIARVIFPETRLNYK